MNSKNALSVVEEMAKLFLFIGSIAMVLAVGLGAFGAHALKARLPADMLEIFETGVRYHFYHALGILVVGLLGYHLPDSVWLKAAGWLMAAGIVIFSGSLYLLSTTGITWLGAITPIGGFSFILAWIFLATAVVKNM
ncbi:MAG: DUF423 domain-containing protein [Balneolaceae bacterium]|nr:DUF423 domain-containing protein [Balneolaceae bacterium]